jgi:hypothetical protein
VIKKLVISNGRSERELLLVGSIVVGRDPTCHVSEPDPLLSRRHAEILANMHGVSIRDLNSRNGILVNGEKTREQILLPGDVVQMGHLQLRYLEEHARPSETLMERSAVRRPMPPESVPAARPDAFDRVGPEAQQAPGRWKPEPTPLPGRRSTRSTPPAAIRYPQPSPPEQRGRAAFPDAPPPPVRQPDPFEQTIAARVPLPPRSTPAAGTPSELDETVFAYTALARPAFGVETTLGPGHAAFDSALAHLSGFAQVDLDQNTAPMEQAIGAALIANAELAITHATPECAELLGIPDEQLVGDSLPDVFLRAVRRAYAQPETAVSLSIRRGPHGTITVTIILQPTAGAA